MRVSSSSSSTYGTKSAKQSRGVRVLLVDYDTISLHVILAMVKKFGYEAVGTTGGLHGLKLLREKPYYFDLVVAAVQMPGMSGLELLQRIKLEFANLPVVLISNDTDPVMAEKGFSIGAGHLLRKPVTFYDVENMWLHVQKSKMDETVNKNRYKEQTGSVGQDPLRRKEKHRSVSGSPSGDDDGSSRVESRKRKGSSKDQTSDDKKNRSNTNKKRRVVWTAQLHTHFLNAIECLGVDSKIVSI
ncbi:hypothetical protein MKX03_030124 [Papaver bracteatum]|nr:hypothetical protein MKX03_030124 [Papaver bracteatum]